PPGPRSHPIVPTIELFGQARILTGTRAVSIPAATLGEALRELAARYPELVGRVLESDGRPLPAYALNLCGRRFTANLSEPLTESDSVLVISSLSGG
ncbi:MAG: MoaD/ThiS family protein, partial [Chloroflexota bacterium]|nr:MoaD/ThiS family protein [Chloroflexota bacterium]